WAGLAHALQRRIESGAQIPGWGQRLLRWSPWCVVSVAMAPNGHFLLVGDWAEKLQAIRNDATVRRVVCSVDDRGFVDGSWRKLTDITLFWQKDAQSSCWWADCILADPWSREPRRLQFVACPSADGLLNFLDPHRGNVLWGELRLALAALIAFPFMLHQCL